MLVGLDGMPYGLIRRFTQDGTMPNLAGLAREGVLRPMRSSVPDVSSVAWSSIITGVNPGVHGVYGFTDVAPGTYRLTFPNLNSLQAAPFWERPGSGRSVIVNVPTTYPAREMNGVLIAGFVALDLEKATTPRSLVPRLEAMGYRVDVDSQKAHQSLGFFLKDLQETLEARIAAYRTLWREEAWRTFVLVFTGTDRLAHFLWDAYEDPAHAYHEPFVDHFRQIDAVIGEITGELDGGDVLIVLSDHGFERLESDVYVNHVLKEEGFLAFEDGAPPRLREIAGHAHAFALDPGRIYVHLEGRYPRGGVRAGDREAVLRDIEALFLSLEAGGRRVVGRVYRSEELYEGPCADRAPDLVLAGGTGYNLRGSMEADQFFGRDVFTGKHSPDAFLLAWGDFEKHVVPQTPSVCDVVSTLDAVQGGMAS